MVETVNEYGGRIKLPGDAEWSARMAPTETDRPRPGSKCRSSASKGPRRSSSAPSGVAVVSADLGRRLVVLSILVLFVVIALIRTIRIVPQQTAIIVERLGSTTAPSRPACTC